MQIVIRPEKIDDIASIRALTEEAFRYAEHASHAEHCINDALREAGQLTLSLVAVEGDAIVGHVAISPVRLSDASENWYGLGPIAVSPGHQREGIGSRLIRRALEMIREQGARGCVVLGEPKYYGRFGFEASPTLVLPGVPAAYFQALSFAGSVPVATVEYHESFRIS